VESVAVKAAKQTGTPLVGGPVATSEDNFEVWDEAAETSQPANPLVVRQVAPMQESSLVPGQRDSNDVPQALSVQEPSHELRLEEVSSLRQQLQDVKQEAQEAYLAHEMLEVALPEQVEEQVEAWMFTERESWKLKRVNELKRDLGHRRTEAIREREHQQKLRKQRREYKTDVQQERRRHDAVISKLKAEISMLWNRLNMHDATEAAKDTRPVAKTRADSDGVKTARQGGVRSQRLIGQNLLASGSGTTIYRAPLGPLSPGTRCFRVLCFGDGLQCASADAFEDRLEPFGRALAASLSFAGLACQVAVRQTNEGTPFQDLEQLLGTAWQQDLVLITAKLGSNEVDGGEHDATDMRLRRLHEACHVCNTHTVALQPPRLPNQHDIHLTNFAYWAGVTKGVAALFDCDEVLTAAASSGTMMPPEGRIKEEDGLQLTTVGAQHLGTCLAPLLLPVLMTLPDIQEGQRRDTASGDSNMVLPQGHQQPDHLNLLSCEGMEERLQHLKAKRDSKHAEVEDELVRARQWGFEVCKDERKRAESHECNTKAVQRELAAEASQCREGAKEGVSMLSKRGVYHVNPASIQCFRLSHQHDSKVREKVKTQLLEASRQLQTLVADSRSLEGEKAEQSCCAIAAMVTALLQSCEQLPATQHWALQESPKEVLTAAEVWQAPCMSSAAMLHEEICMERDLSVEALNCHREETEHLLFEADLAWQRQVEGIEASLLLGRQECLQAPVPEEVRGDHAMLKLQVTNVKTAELEQETQARSLMQKEVDCTWASKASWQQRLEQAEIESGAHAQQRLQGTWADGECAVLELCHMHEIELARRTTRFDIQLNEESEEVAQLRSQLQSVEAARCSESQAEQALEDEMCEQLYISEEAAAAARAMLVQQSQKLSRIECNSDEAAATMLTSLENDWNSELAVSAEDTAAVHAALTLQTGLMNEAAQREEQLKCELQKQDYSQVRQICKMSRMQARLVETTERIKTVNDELDHEREKAQRAQADSEQFLYDLHEAHAAELNLATSVFLEALSMHDAGECSEEVRHQLVDMVWDWQGQNNKELLLGDMLPLELNDSESASTVAA